MRREWIIPVVLAVPITALAQNSVPEGQFVPPALNPLLGQSVPNVIFAGAVAGGIVLVLTWLAMPLLVRITKGWLHPKISASNIP